MCVCVGLVAKCTCTLGHHYTARSPAHSGGWGGVASATWAHLHPKKSASGGCGLITHDVIVNNVLLQAKMKVRSVVMKGQPSSGVV